jgi:post-segregation antitoxin (ccd killing protein)
VADFRATGFSTHDPAAIRTELTTELARIDAAVSSRLAATEYTAPPDVSALATSAEIAALESHGDAAWTTADVSGLSTFDPAISSVDIGSVAGVAVFGVADFRATGFSTHDPAAVVVAMQASAADFHADVSSLATTARIDALESHGDTNWTCDGGGTAGPTAEEIRIEMDANSAKLANLDAAVSSRLSAADYAAPPDVSALATSAEIAALESHGDTNWLSVDVSGLSTHSPADTANAVLSGLLTPHDEIEGSTAQALSRLDTNVSSITVGEVEVSVDASTIHDALDTWNPAQAENPPPLITPPPAAEDCRVFLWFGGVGANDTPSVLDGAALRIVALPSVRHGRFFGGDKSPVLADGLAYWDVVRGARVRVSVPCCGVDDDVDIPPDAATLDLAEFFTIP